MAQQKILIVEDEEPVLKVLSEKLSAEGFRTLLARDGVQGLKTALAKKPDLILLDILLPVMDGITMLKKLREDEWGKKVPVLILTNLSGAENVAQALLQGAFDYLIKTDWTLEDLVRKVKTQLAQSKNA